MQGSWNNGSPYYRCRYPAEYVLVNRPAHPRNVYVRERDIVPVLDDWLYDVFDPERLEKTCRALTEAQIPEVADEVKLAAAERVMAECDAKLERYRAALEAGTDPAVVAAWIREVTGRRKQVEKDARAAASAPTWTREDIRARIEELDVLRLLKKPEPEKRAAREPEVRTRSKSRSEPAGTPATTRRIHRRIHIPDRVEADAEVGLPGDQGPNFRKLLQQMNDILVTLGKHQPGRWQRGAAPGSDENRACS